MVESTLWQVPEFQCSMLFSVNAFFHGIVHFYFRYLDKQKSEAGYNEQLCWWHKKLANYYRSSGTFERKVEVWVKILRKIFS